MYSQYSQDFTVVTAAWDLVLASCWNENKVLLVPYKPYKQNQAKLNLTEKQLLYNAGLPSVTPKCFLKWWLYTGKERLEAKYCHSLCNSFNQEKGENLKHILPWLNK